VLDRGKLVAEGTPEELKRCIPGGHIRLQFTDATVLANAARIFGEVSRDDDALTLQISTDGGIRSLRALLDQLEQEHIEVDALTVHTPDLDDVYFALTGHPVFEKEPAS
jgi:ABC-2 type transport system ATP-binding protein